MSGRPVSVILPTFGRPALLPRALRSVIAQSSLPAEIIIVDDNAELAQARAETAAAVDDLREGAPRKTPIRYLKAETVLGGGAARNYGAAQASGEFFAFLDDDDWWLPQKLERQLGVFEAAKHPPGLVYTSRRIVGSDGQTNRVRTATHRGWIFDVLLASNVIGTTSSAMIPKAVFEEVGGFDESLPSQQDIDLWLRISRTHQVDFVEEALTVQQEHAEGRISRRFANKARGLEQFLAKHHAEISGRPSVLAAQRARIGTHYLKYGHPLRGRWWLLKALTAVPSRSVLKRLVVGL